MLAKWARHDYLFNKLFPQKEAPKQVVPIFDITGLPQINENIFEIATETVLA